MRPRGTVDKDKSGRIVFREFQSYVRTSAPNGLGLSKKACSDDKLQVRPPAAATARLCSHCTSTAAHASCPRWQAVWVALDVSNNGCLKSKEFGAFMRRGQSADGGEDWKTRLQRQKAAEGAAVRATLDQETGRATNASFAGVKPAGKSELERMSKLFNGCLGKRPSHLRDPHKLWCEVDVDGSGRIQYDEFEMMVRAPSLVEPMHACQIYTGVKLRARCAGVSRSRGRRCRTSSCRRCGSRSMLTAPDSSARRTSQNSWRSVGPSGAAASSLERMLRTRA